MIEYLIFQRVGDRDKVSYSIKPYAFTIPANPMSDRIQKVLEIYIEKCPSREKEKGLINNPLTNKEQ